MTIMVSYYPSSDCIVCDELSKAASVKSQGLKALRENMARKGIRFESGDYHILISAKVFKSVKEFEESVFGNSFIRLSSEHNYEGKYYPSTERESYQFFYAPAHKVGLHRFPFFSPCAHDPEDWYEYKGPGHNDPVRTAEDLLQQRYRELNPPGLRMG